MRAITPALSVALAAAALAPPSALAGSSHVSNWGTARQQVVCGIAAGVPGTVLDAATQAPLTGLWPGLQCSARGIPRPAHGIGDPFVQLGQGASGRARLVDESQDDLLSDAPYAKLSAGMSWQGDGITCAVHASWVRCANSAGHGFTLSPGHLHVF